MDKMGRARNGLGQSWEGKMVALPRPAHQRNRSPDRSILFLAPTIGRWLRNIQ